MAISSNTLFTVARKAFLEGQIDWLNDNIRVMLLRDTNALTEASLSLGSAPQEDRASPGVLLQNKSTEGGAADGNDVTFTAVTGGTISNILIYKDGGTSNETDSMLIAIIGSATGLPITPNGGDIIVTWDNGTNKIFRL